MRSSPRCEIIRNGAGGELAGVAFHHAQQTMCNVHQPASLRHESGRLVVTELVDCNLCPVPAGTHEGATEENVRS